MGNGDMMEHISRILRRWHFFSLIFLDRRCLPLFCPLSHTIVCSHGGVIQDVDLSVFLAHESRSCIFNLKHRENGGRQEPFHFSAPEPPICICTLFSFLPVSIEMVFQSLSPSRSLSSCNCIFLYSWVSPLFLPYLLIPVLTQICSRISYREKKMMFFVSLQLLFSLLPSHKILSYLSTIPHPSSSLAFSSQLTW